MKYHLILSEKHLENQKATKHNCQNDRGQKHDAMTTQRKS